ncbi:MAG: squalene synthase HpnC [Rhodocyclaceae bacterium]|nr:squalene synthase HpnC [Rhodocyclaceae bacterium]MBX3666880.1 squalene synthase HpnC [Rhodocyclaceae bacterium]
MPVDHYENFPVASWLLPAHLREPVAAVYWFARRADDAADEGDATPAQRLAALGAMRAQLDLIAAGRQPDDAVAARLARALATHALPLPACYDLLDAFAQDVVKTRYADFAELRDYCRRSADPVGRLMLALYRAATPQHLAWSDAICTSLQLINHWQDVAVDWHKNPPEGRVYLPLDEMQRYGVSLAHLAEARCDDAWRALMRFQVERARGLMVSGAPLARRLPGRIGLELRAVVAGGLRILEKIEAVDYDVFRRRPKLGRADAPRLVWRALFG